MNHLKRKTKSKIDPPIENSTQYFKANYSNY